MANYGDTLYGLDNPLAENSDEVLELMHANGIYNKRDMDWYKKFRRFPGADPYNALIGTHEYVFFTKPDLHLLNSSGTVATSLSEYSFFNSVVDRYHAVCEQLQYSLSSSAARYTRSSNPFMTILSNSITSELEVPDLESENDQETGANVYGTKITYRGNSYTADQDLSFSIEFEDNRYLEVYMLFKIYDEYCRYKNLGLIQLDLSDTEDSVWVNYTFNKVLHDQFAIYKFITADDGMTILYWGKYTGVYPTGAPRGSFSSMSGQDGQKHTVQFKAQFFRDMDPIIINEFNNLCNKISYSNELLLYNTDEHRINGEWAVSPYIKNTSVDSRGYTKRNLSDIDKFTQYQLRWRK